MNVNQDKDMIRIDQETYITRLLDTHGMADTSIKTTPMELLSTSRSISLLDCPKEGSEEQQEMAKMPFRELTGSLMYALNTHPEIRFAVNQMSKAASNPSKRHWQLGMRILRYLKGVATKGLTFNKSNNMTKLESFLAKGKSHPDVNRFICLSDTDWGGEPTTGRSTRGYAIYFKGNLVSSRSKTNKAVCINVSEAELMVATLATQEILHLRILAEELDFHDLPRPTLFADNAQVISWTMEPNAEQSRSRHLSIEKYWLAELSESILTIQHLPQPK